MHFTGLLGPAEVLHAQSEERKCWAHASRNPCTKQGPGCVPWKPGRLFWVLGQLISVSGSNVSYNWAPIFYGCFGVLLGGRNVWDKNGCKSRECWITLLINTGFWSLLTADSVSVWPAPIKPQQHWDKEEAVSTRVWCTRSRVHNAAPSLKAQAQLAQAGGHRTGAPWWWGMNGLKCRVRPADRPHSLLCREALCQLMTFIWGTRRAVGHGSAN